MDFSQIRQLLALSVLGFVLSPLNGYCQDSPTANSQTKNKDHQSALSQLALPDEKDSEVDLGKIYIAPPGQAERPMVLPQTPGHQELSGLQTNDELQIRKTIENLERKMHMRKNRAKTYSRRPCI